VRSSLEQEYRCSIRPSLVFEELRKMSAVLEGWKRRNVKPLTKMKGREREGSP